MRHVDFEHVEVGFERKLATRADFAALLVKEGERTLRIIRDAQDGAMDLRNLVEDSQTQLYVVRPDGSVQARLPVFTLGTLQAEVQGTQGLTPFVRAGNAPALGVGVLVLLIAFVRRRRAKAD